jgi:CxxC motif-containing protein (DUF1111 family)
MLMSKLSSPDPAKAASSRRGRGPEHAGQEVVNVVAGSTIEALSQAATAELAVAARSGRVDERVLQGRRGFGLMSCVASAANRRVTSCSAGSPRIPGTVQNNTPAIPRTGFRRR